jgi:hypothetical protein
MDIINNIFRNAIPFDIWNQLQTIIQVLIYMYIHLNNRI